MVAHDMHQNKDKRIPKKSCNIISSESSFRSESDLNEIMLLEKNMS